MAKIKPRIFIGNWSENEACYIFAKIKKIIHNGVRFLLGTLWHITRS